MDDASRGGEGRGDDALSAPGGDALAAELLSRCRFPATSEGPVALAVSGGPDSTALMILARSYGLEGLVVHVDHGLRDDSQSEAEVVAKSAQALGFAFESRKVEVPDGPDLEARARRARYEALPSKVLTGHTMDDQAETVLLNVLRGSATDGLRGMRQVLYRDAGGRVTRPLLGLRRHETDTLCRLWGLEVVRDPSNRDPRFRRNRLRHEGLPLLSDIAGRDVVPVLARQAEIIDSEVEILDAWAEALDAASVGDLLGAPLPVARRALRMWLRRAPRGGQDQGEQHPPSSAELERVMEVVCGHRRACQISGGLNVRRRQGRLFLSAPGAAGAASGMGAAGGAATAVAVTTESGADRPQPGGQDFESRAQP